MTDLKVIKPSNQFNSRSITIQVYTWRICDVKRPGEILSVKKAFCQLTGITIYWLKETIEKENNGL